MLKMAADAKSIDHLPIVSNSGAQGPFKQTDGLQGVPVDHVVIVTPRA